MKYLTLILALILFALPPAHAAQDVVLRTSLEPETAWIGQRVRLHVEVLAVDGWGQIPDLGDPQIPGAYALQTSSQGSRLNETIDGESYTGQRYELSIFAQRDGILEIPPLPVTVVVKRWGAQSGDDELELVTPATSLNVRTPPGAEGIRGLISTTRLDASQTWSAEPDTLLPGDAITRIITLDAVDISAMAFPPMQHPDLEGVGTYPGEPTVTDNFNRGSLDGRRVESVTYVCENPGRTELPALILPWWDIEAELLRQIELPGLSFHVLSPPSLPASLQADADGPTQPGPELRWIITGVLALLVILLAATRLPRLFRERREARLKSEAHAFSQLRSALRGKHPVTISAAVMHWLDRLDTGMRPARLDLFLQKHGDERARATATELTRCMATGETFAEAGNLGKGLKKARRKMRQANKLDQRIAGLLPELNS